MCEVLLIGKESRLRDEISFYLDSSNYHSISVSPVEVDVDSMDFNKFTHVIINYEFPVFRSLTLIEGIRKRVELPIIIITSNTSSSFKKAVFEAGVNQVINKPFIPKTLIELIRHEKA